MSSSVLERPTLVLNRNWQPVAVSTVARALIKVWNESARIVDPSSFQIYGWEDWASLRPADGDPVIRTQWLTLKVPEVITLTRYDRLPVKIVAFSRRNVFKRVVCARPWVCETLLITEIVEQTRLEWLHRRLLVAEKLRLGLAHLAALLRVAVKGVVGDFLAPGFLQIGGELAA